MKKIIFSLTILFLISAMFVVIGCYSSSKNVSDSTADAQTVSIQDFKFVPSVITIKKGETVTWVNNDSAVHTVSGDEINSGSINRGSSYSQVFKNNGTFNYSCSIHPSMKGQVIVK